MSESTAGNPAATETANAAGGETTENSTTQTTSASEVNARLLEESKANKKKAQELQAQLDGIKRASLEKQSEFKKLYEEEKSKNDKLFKSVVNREVKNAVEKVASKAGAIDFDAVMALGDRQLLVVHQSESDDTFSVDGVETFIDDLKKKKPNLFTVTKSAAVNGVTPGGTTQSNKKQLKDLTKEELLAQLRALG